jgi:phage-related baseplate assembly protein
MTRLTIEKAIRAATLSNNIKSEADAKQLSPDDQKIVKQYISENPHGYPAFSFGELVVYAVNEEAARAKADKILKKKTAKPC